MPSQLRVIEGTKHEPPREPSNLWMRLFGAGAAIIVGSALITATHMEDRIAFTLLVPGVVVGLTLVVASVIVRKR